MDIAYQRPLSPYGLHSSIVVSGGEDDQGRFDKCMGRLLSGDEAKGQSSLVSINRDTMVCEGSPTMEDSHVQIIPRAGPGMRRAPQLAQEYESLLGSRFDELSDTPADFNAETA